jgi:DinB family protein
VARTHMKTSELESYQDQLLSIRQDGSGLMSGLSDAQFNWQPEPGRWSMAGCFDHLNLSAAKLFMPSIDAALATAKAQNLKSNGPFVYSAFERWCVRTNDAPARMRFKAPRRVQPAQSKSIDEVRAAFLHWQDEFGKRLNEADGVDLRRARHKSPIPLVKWSLGAFFQLMLAHERRHIWQARLVRQSAGFPQK